MDCSLQYSGEDSYSYGNSGNPYKSTVASSIKFADLFSGLGGFHVGLSKLGMQCIFASELDDELRKLYQNNFGFLPEGDIRGVDEKNIPPHDVLCAGFPCQPFSVAGKKRGAACPSSGKLINDVLRIAAHHLPNFIMLENVPNILTIQNGEFWAYIRESLGDLGYEVDYRIYSPHEFGIPQKRNRVFVVASRVGLGHFDWPTAKSGSSKSIKDLINPDAGNVRKIEPAKLEVLQKWQQLLSKIGKTSYLSIVVPEFGATYPLDGLGKLSLDEIRKFKGAFGQSLYECETWNDVYACLPHYTRGNTDKIPEWLLASLVYSRELYTQHKNFIDGWKADFPQNHNSWQKLEWRGLKGTINIWDHIIQFRASGIRVIKPTCAPSLVAMTPTQTPILGSEQRYMGVREAASLQSLESLKQFPGNNARAFKALGNAVNAFIVGEIARNLVL